MALLTDSQISRLLDIAYAGCHKGMVSESRTIYDAVLVLKPGFVPALIGRAYTSLVVDEFDEAERILREVLAEHPDDADARVQLGLCLFLAGRRDEATDIFRDLAAGDGPAAALSQSMLQQV